MGEQASMNLITQLWEKMKTKRFREGYTKAQLSIEVPFQIRALRNARGWTQAELANRCDLSPSRIAKIETPGQDALKPQTLQKIASAFDVGLLIQFVPFSELVRREQTFHPETFNVVSFDDDASGSTRTVTMHQPTDYLDFYTQTSPKLFRRIPDSALLIEIKMSAAKDIPIIKPRKKFREHSHTAWGSTDRLVKVRTRRYSSDQGEEAWRPSTM